MKLSKKIFVLMATLSLLVISNVCYAATIPTEVELNQTLTITYNNEVQRFKNVKNEVVYPISYEGTTYLPIRSISCLFKTPIMWDGATNSIHLGKGELDVIAAESIPEFVPGTNQMITVDLNQDIKIYYNDEVQTFTDVNKKVVYPLSYQGTTYLPVRAISNLYNAKIDWIAETSTVTIEKNDTPFDWNGKFVSNVDGYVTLELTPAEDNTVNFYFRGYTLANSQIAGRESAKVNGNVAVYEGTDFFDETIIEDKIEFRYVNNKVIVSVPLGDYTCFEGEYVLDDGTINEVIFTNENSLTGEYQNGDVTLKITDRGDALELDFASSEFFFGGREVAFENGVWTMEEESFGELEKIKLTVNGDSLAIESSSTEKDGTLNKVSGTYTLTKKGITFEEIKQQLNGFEIYVDGFMY